MKKLSSQEVANKLDKMQLPEHLQNMVDTTDFSLISEMFGDCDTVEDLQAIFDDMPKED